MNQIFDRLSSESHVETAWIPNKETNNEYLPRTALGKKLMALRCAYIESGGALFGETEIETELRTRCGGVDG